MVKKSRNDSRSLQDKELGKAVKTKFQKITESLIA